MQPLRPGEEFDSEDNRLGAYACRLWLPMLRAERIADLMERFDLLGPLPGRSSTTVLEASAGTGKTFALAGLVTRYLAEGEATLDQMLLITFSRAASQELRERVRRQIVDAVSRFRRSVDGRRQPTGRAPARRHRGRACGRASSGCAMRWPASTRRRSPPPTSSASWC